MKLPLSWLKRYIDPGVSPKKLAELLTMSGTAIERVERSGAGAVLEAEVTTNRPDCLSILGLAREAAALSGKKLRLPGVSAKNPGGPARIKVRVLDRAGCPFYTARTFETISVKGSPGWAASLIESAGVRPVSNVVDATNFVLFETGQPLHAFDADKLKGGVIVVRRAKKNEPFTAIDGQSLVLDEKTLVIADAERAIAIAGVMGGRDTEVSASTKRVVLESAWFDPVLVRQASKHYKLVTESSYRFERGVDPLMVERASARARDLMAEWAGAVESGPLVKAGSPGVSPKPVLLSQDEVRRILGVVIPRVRLAAILTRLGFRAAKKSNALLSVTPPSWRRDVRLEADLIEEIARIHGFDKIPATIPLTRHAGFEPDRKAEGVLELKKFLAHQGLHEAVTTGLLSEKALRDSGFTDLSGALMIKNPVSAEQAYLRPSTLTGLLGAVSFNVQRKQTPAGFFEIGNRTCQGTEQTALGIALYGPLGENWRRREPATFHDLKGIFENVFAFLNLKVDMKPEGRRLAFGGSRAAGWMGEVPPEVLRRWDIPHELFFGELVLDKAWKTAGVPQAAFRVQAPPKFPSVKRDIAILVAGDVAVGSLEETMRRAAPYVNDVRLFDEFTGKNIPPGKRSLAFSLSYQKDTGTFTDAEIVELQKRVAEALKAAHGAEFR